MHGHMKVTMHGHMKVTMHGHMNVTMHGHNLKNVETSILKCEKCRTVGAVPFVLSS
jgi:hypothetical protein